MLEKYSVRTSIAWLAILLLAAAGCGNGDNGGNPCDGVECNSPPNPTCDGTDIVTYEDEGYCEDGDCIYPEERIPCDDPPPSYCDGDVEVSYDEMGVCVDAECEYTETETVCADIEHVCDADAGGCVDLCADVSCPPRDTWCDGDTLMMEVGHCDWETGDCEYEEVETDLPDCAFAYNFDFELWTDDQPDGFYLDPTSGFSVIPETLEVNSGRRSALLESTVAEDRNLMPSIPFEHLTEGEQYTFHFWYRLEGQPDGESAGSLRPIIRLDEGSVTGTRITEPVETWREATLTTPPMSRDRESLRPFLRLRRAEDAAGGWAHTDDWAVTVPRPRNLNGRRDLDSQLFLFNESYWVAAGIDNQGVLYPSARSADDEYDYDQLLFSWVGEPDDRLVPAPWDKDGRVAGPSAGGALFALAQSVTGYCEWLRYDPEDESWGAVGHSDCSNREGDPTGLQYSLEGTLNLVAHLDGVELPTEVPPWFHFAASYWETGDGGSLLSHTQVPASADGDGNINAGETHRAHRASFLSGKVDSPYVTIVP